MSKNGVHEMQTTVADSLPQGLLRWDIQVPPHRTGDNAFSVSYDLEIERKEGVEMTPLPD